MPSPDSRTYGDATEPIAIVGMASSFPGEATTLSRFWDMILHGRTGHSAVPADRFDAEAWYHPSHERKGTVAPFNPLIEPRSGFFLGEDPALFGAPFFSLTAKEAAGMDPMQRKLLEISYEAFENGKLSRQKTDASSLRLSFANSWYPYNQGSWLCDETSGTSRAMLANRISWFYDLRGPSFALDTACSSSLYALHLACQSLQAGETVQALVTGVNLVLAPNFISQLSSMHMLSPDGRSHSFDSRANGYAREEALAAVVVKPLSRALADGDTIRAVIRGSGANQDGKTVGITVPNGTAQAELIRNTYAAAGLGMDQTAYFEAHGTGTPVGDPIEPSAIGGSFGEQRSRDNPLIVGSVKTNIGHTEGSTGLAGVVKTVLALETGIILHLADFQELNERLRLEEWKLTLPLTPTPWPTRGLRRASVNSFGFEEASWEEFAVTDLAYTLSERRTTFDFRSFAVAPSLQDLASKIDKDGLPRLNRISHRPNAAFVFTGQGAQWPAMGRELLGNPIFRASIDRSKAVLEQEGCKWDVLELLSDPKDRRIDAPAFSQPVCTIVQVALVDLLQAWGVQPGATVGHSSGEVAAAYAARLLSQDDAVRIGYWRGFYSEQVKDRLGDQRGSMMAVGLSEAQANAYLGNVPECSVVVACVNSPSSVTLSGEEGSIDILEKVLQGDGRFARKLRVQVAYHSPHMRAVADEFLSAVGIIEPQCSNIAMFSSVMEAQIEDPSTLIASYWMQNLISPVRFSGALTNLLNYARGGKAKPGRRRAGASAWSTLVEIGPHEALKGPCRQIMSAWDTRAADQITYLSLLSRGRDAVETS
ncbi:thiolase-like protein [Aspergillus aurantiobrunneus]